MKTIIKFEIRTVNEDCEKSDKSIYIYQNAEINLEDYIDKEKLRQDLFDKLYEEGMLSFGNVAKIWREKTKEEIAFEGLGIDFGLHKAFEEKGASDIWIDEEKREMVLNVFLEASIDDEPVSIKLVPGAKEPELLTNDMLT